MRIGTSIALLVVGGILAAALEFDIPLIDLGALGSILVIVGLVGLAVTVGLELYQSRPRRARGARRRRDPPPGQETARRREPERPYDPVLPPRGRSPRRPPSSEDPTRVAPRRDQ